MRLTPSALKRYGLALYCGMSISVYRSPYTYLQAVRTGPSFGPHMGFDPYMGMLTHEGLVTWDRLVSRGVRRRVRDGTEFDRAI